jgi:hypothetical protein
MKLLKIVGLGIAIWGSSLLWPEVNLVLTPAVMVGLIIGFIAMIPVVGVLRRRLDQHHQQTKGDGQNHSSHPTHPIPVICATGHLAR